jgi:hypothetical protein
MKKLSISILAAILALVTFEFFLKYSPFEYGISPGIYDKEIGVWHKKNFSGYSISECYRNRYIYNDKGLPKELKPYDSKKNDIVLLGDSFVEAMMVKNEQIIHNELAKRVDFKYNVLNYGVSGTSPIQAFMILQKKVDFTHLKYVIQFIELNGDILEVNPKNINSMGRPKVHVDFTSLTNYKVIPPRDITIKDKVGDFLGEYQIYFFIKQLVYSLQTKLSKNKPKEKLVKGKKIPNLSKNWLNLEGSIFQTYQIAKKHNIKFLVIINHRDVKKKERLQKFLKAQNIPSLSIQEEANKKGIKLVTYKCDAHWTDETHGKVAQIIIDSGFID